MNDVLDHIPEQQYKSSLKRFNQSKPEEVVPVDVLGNEMFNYKGAVQVSRRNLAGFKQNQNNFHDYY